MSRPFIVLGDKTDHGGVVIEAAPTSDAAGKGLARVGDKVTCPQRGHGDVTVIVSGDPTMVIDGRAVARHGDKTACGATLIAGQAVAYVDAASGGTGSSSSASAASVATLAAKLASPKKPDASEAFDIHFRLEDNKTGRPLAGIPYRLKLSNGKEVLGTTDSSGLTATIAADRPETATLEAPYYGDDTSHVNAGIGSDACRC